MIENFLAFIGITEVIRRMTIMITSMAVKNMAKKKKKK
jgi:TRAP-type mannitol/chloroaromatic compound transport system permease small subunit